MRGSSTESPRLRPPALEGRDRTEAICTRLPLPQPERVSRFLSRERSEKVGKPHSPRGRGLPFAGTRCPHGPSSGFQAPAEVFGRPRNSCHGDSASGKRVPGRPPAHWRKAAPLLCFSGPSSPRHGRGRHREDSYHHFTDNERVQVLEGSLRGRREGLRGMLQEVHRLGREDQRRHSV